MKIWICGAAGFMGRAVYEQVKAAGLEVAGGIDLVDPGSLPFPVYASFDQAPVCGDAIIDFSKPGTLDALLRYATANHIPAVIATTGFNAEQLAAIDEAAKVVPIFRSANMSIGIALLRQLSRKAAEVLGDAFDVEIVEAHHNRKVDAPSGTALMLYDAVKDAYEEPRTALCGRTRESGKRQHNEIGLHAVRGGTVTGEHEVMFLGPQERITLSHSAESRAVFAVGAVRAAQFLIGKAPGMYTMDDMLA